LARFIHTDIEAPGSRPLMQPAPRVRIRPDTWSWLRSHQRTFRPSLRCGVKRWRRLSSRHHDIGTATHAIHARVASNTGLGSEVETLAETTFGRFFNPQTLKCEPSKKNWSNKTRQLI